MLTTCEKMRHAHREHQREKDKEEVEQMSLDDLRHAVLELREFQHMAREHLVDRWYMDVRPPDYHRRYRIYSVLYKGIRDDSDNWFDTPEEAREACAARNSRTELVGRQKELLDAILKAVEAYKR